MLTLMETEKRAAGNILVADTKENLITEIEKILRVSIKDNRQISKICGKFIYDRNRLHKEADKINLFRVLLTDLIPLIPSLSAQAKIKALKAYTLLQAFNFDLILGYVRLANATGVVRSGANPLLNNAIFAYCLNIIALEDGHLQEDFLAVEPLVEFGIAMMHYAPLHSDGVAEIINLANGISALQYALKIATNATNASADVRARYKARCIETLTTAKASMLELKDKLQSHGEPIIKSLCNALRGDPIDFVVRQVRSDLVAVLCDCGFPVKRDAYEHARDSKNRYPDISSFQQIYRTLMSSSKEYKKQVMETGKAIPGSSSKPTVVEAIGRQIFVVNSEIRVRAMAELSELFKDKKFQPFQPLLCLAAFACIMPVGVNKPRQLKIIIGDITKLFPEPNFIGLYSGKNTIYLDESTFETKALLHELLHWTLTFVYGHGGLPYLESDTTAKEKVRSLTREIEVATRSTEGSPRSAGPTSVFPVVFSGAYCNEKKEGEIFARIADAFFREDVWNSPAVQALSKYFDKEINPRILERLYSLDAASYIKFSFPAVKAERSLGGIAEIKYIISSLFSYSSQSEIDQVRAARSNSPPTASVVAAAAKIEQRR